MPRRKRTEDELYYAKLSAMIKARMDVYGITPEGAGKVAGVSQSTFYARLRNPEGFTIGELRGLAKLLHTSLLSIIKLEAFCLEVEE